MKRLEGEDFEDYKKRRAAINRIFKLKLIPKLIWRSRGFYLTEDKEVKLEKKGNTYRKSLHGTIGS